MIDLKFDPNAIKKEVEDGTYETFRSLVKKGIGSRTQKEFAEQAGISRVNLNRVLNAETIARPSKRTLYAYSMHMKGVTYRDLMEACGYPMDDIHEAARQIADDLRKRLDVCRGKIYEKYDGIEKDLSEGMTVSFTWTHHRCIRETILTGDEVLKYHAIWTLSPYICATDFLISYVNTNDKRKVVTGFQMDEQVADQCSVTEGEEELDREAVTVIRNLEEHPYKKKDIGAEEKLLTAIFGSAFGESVTTYKTGCGFVWDWNPWENKEYPEGFREFVKANVPYFCDTKENAAMYRRILDTDDPCDEVFYEFCNNDLAEGEEESPAYRDLYEHVGAGAAVAYILTRIMHKKVIFHHFRQDGGDEKGVIMCELPEDEELPGGVLYAVYCAARMLNRKEFGRVYFEYKKAKKRDSYKTETAYFQ